MDEVEQRRAYLVKAARERLAEIHSFLRRLGVDAATAEDLAQDTFLIAWQRASRLRGAGLCSRRKGAGNPWRGSPADRFRA